VVLNICLVLILTFEESFVGFVVSWNYSVYERERFVETIEEKSNRVCCVGADRVWIVERYSRLLCGIFLRGMEKLLLEK